MLTFVTSIIILYGLNMNSSNYFVHALVIIIIRIYLSCRSSSVMVVHVRDLGVIAQQEVQGKMYFHVTKWGAMESSGLLGK